jgi:hypothetical protein
MNQYFQHHQHRLHLQHHIQENLPHLLQDYLEVDLREEYYLLHHTQLHNISNYHLHLNHHLLNHNYFV